MNNRVILGACLSAFTVASVSLPVFAFRTAPVISKAKTQNVVASKLTKKTKKISLNGKATSVISCGKK